MTEIAVSHKYFSVTASEQGWTYVTERSQLGGVGDTLPSFLRVFSQHTSRMFGPALPVTMEGQLVAYRYHHADGQDPPCEVMVLNV